MLAAGDYNSAYRSPLVVVPVDAISDKQGIPWMVVGPTSDAHFDKDAGGRELARLSEHKLRRQMEIDRHREWRDDLESLKHRLQQYQTEHPRGWFSDRGQKLEVLASRLEEATQSADRLAKRQAELEAKAEGIRGQIQALSKSHSQKERHQDRMEQFDRNFGSHLGDWRRHLELTRDRAKKSRLRQDALKQEASEDEDKAEQSVRQAEASARSVCRLETERSQVKYCEEPARQPKAGATEVLRSCYQLLLADYEGKVNADSLSHRAAGNDEAAVREMREFQRVIQQFPDIRDDAVEAELRKLPEGLSVQEQLELADEDYDAAWRKLGPLTNRRDAVAGEYESAGKECDELARTGPLPAISEADSADGHAARAEAARREAVEQAELAKAFDAEVVEIADGLTKTTHEMDNVKKDQDRLETIRQSYRPQFDRLGTATQESPASGTAVPTAVKDSESLASGIGELERRLTGVREKHESLDERRNKAAKDVADWLREERFGKLRSSVSHRFLDRDVSTLEAKAEFDISQLDDYVFQVEEKLKEADKQREVVVHVLSTAVRRGFRTAETGFPNVDPPRPSTASGEAVPEDRNEGFGQSCGATRTRRRTDR